MTIDYGSSWNGILSNDGSRHLRTYGPAHRAAGAQANVDRERFHRQHPDVGSLRQADAERLDHRRQLQSAGR